LKPKLVALNILLLAALGAIVWEGRTRWQEAQAERQKNLSAAIKPAVVTAAPPAPAPGGAQPIQYADVATKDLFAKDRNPNVIVDAPKIEAPKPMPPLPVVYGVLGLPSGTRAIMAAKQGGDSRSVHQGDQVGEFKIVSLDPQDVVFDWDGKQISRKIEDLMDRSGAVAPIGGSAGPGRPATAAPTPTAVTAGPQKADDPKQTERPCKPGDNSPAGTVVDGFKKVYAVAASPFGPMGCRWVAVQ
jgi:hypothetical protein